MQYSTSFPGRLFAWLTRRCTDTSRTRIAREAFVNQKRRVCDVRCRNNFSFKCHRRDQTPNAKDQSLVYAVNDITFHPVHGTFSTCGAPHSPALQHVFTHVCMNRLRWNYSFLGQGRAHAAKEYVLMYWFYWDLLLPLCYAAFEAAPGPICATTFNRNGTIFAYAVSYDWSKGHSGMTPGHPNKLMLHACKEEEVKRRPKK